MKQAKNLLLLSLLAALLLPFTALSAQTVWDGTVATEFAGGTGTQDDPYLISDGAELAYLAQQVNSGNSGYYYKLTNDIILNNEVLTIDFELSGTPVNQWTPIGIGSYFRGYFDGDNHIVSGVYVPESMNMQFAGLFGKTSTAEIHHLAVVDSYVAATWGAGAVAGNPGDGRSYITSVHHCYGEARACGIGTYCFIGALVGHIDWSSQVQYCYSSGYVTGTYNFGGIAGHSDRGSVQNCFSACKIGSGGTYVGGCIGQSYDATANNLYFDQTKAPDFPVLGYGSGSSCEGKTTEEMYSHEFAELLGEPFVYDGSNYPFIEGLPRVGDKNVIAVTGERIYVGQLTNSLGSNFRFFAEYENDVLKRAVRSAEPGATVYIQPKYARLMTLLKGSITVTADKTGSSLTVNDLGNDVYSFTMPESSVTVTAKFIRDRNVLDTWDGTVATAFAGGNGTRKDPYLIATASQLAYLAQQTNNSGSDTRDKYYRLTNDILLNSNVLTPDYELNDSSARVWTPIGNGVSYYTGFQGDFDGGGHVISGLYFANNDDVAYVGLFGTLAQNAVVHDLSVVDAYISSSKMAGVIAGGLYYSPTLRRCYADGRVTGTAGYSGILTGGSGNSASALVEYCYAKGKADNPNAAAGFMPHFHSGTVRNSYVVGNITCDNSSTGAFFGYMPGTPKASRLYYDKTVDSHLTAYGGKDYTTCYGMTTAEMKTQAFADQLGAPFVYAEGKYPYVKGLLAIGDKASFVESGYQLKVGELTGNRGSTPQFYADYENGDVKKSVSFIDEGKTVYVLIRLGERMLYEDGSLVITNDMNSEPVPVNHVEGNVYSFVMLGSSVTATACFYYDPVAPAEWDGTASNSFADGSGTAEDPYIISSGSELAYLAQITNANGALTNGKYYSIVRDIELNSEVLTDNFGLNNLNGRTFLQWTPIGNTSSNSFQGTLEGNNHVISGAYLYGGKNTGLFGYLNNAVVRNLSLVDSYNTGQNIGMFAYKADSTTVSRVYVEGSAQNSADYSGYDAALLINQLGPNSKVEFCYVKGSVGRGSYNRCSGAGLVYIQDETAVIRNCFAACGDFRAVYIARNKDNISHVYGDNDLGEDFTTHDTFCAKHTIELQTTDFAKLIGAPFEYVLGNYPYIPGLLKIGENRGWKTPEDPTHGGTGGIWDGEMSVIFASGSGTEADPYIINNGAQLSYLAKLTNANGNLTKGRYYQLGADIMLNDAVLRENFGLNNLDGQTFIQWTPIGSTTANSFQGTLDGNNHVISGAYLNGGQYTGLFGYLNNAVVSNLSLVDCYNSGQNIGLLAYKADSTTVSRVYVEGSAQNSADYSGYDAALLINQLGPNSKVEYCYTKGSVSRGWYNRNGGAGLVYIQDKTAFIRNCFTASGEFRAIYSAQNKDNISHVYGDNDLGEDFTTHDTFCAKHTIELQTTDFAHLIGAPFEYVLGNYPYIPGLLKINENRGWKTPEDPTHGGAGGVWDGETSVIFASGSGTEADPYIINNGAQLNYLAKLTNANGNLTKGRYYRMEADIILNDSVLTENFSLDRSKTYRTCEAIGTTEKNKFHGVFDGNFYSISGFFLNGSGSQGFFGYTDNAVIKNLSLLDSYISSTNSALLVCNADSTELKYCFVEGCAQNANNYSNNSAAVLVNHLGAKSLMEYCYASGLVYASSNNSKGSLIIIMDDSATVRNCYSTVNGVPAIYNARGTVSNVYFDSERAGSTNNTRDDYRSAVTVEMQSIEFAERMGAPYEYEHDYYPYIYGLPKINKTGHAEVAKGYSLRLGKLTNGSSSTLQFYRTYDKKTNTLKNTIVSGSKVFVEDHTQVYVKVNTTDSRLLSDEGLDVKNDVTGEQIALTKLADDLFMFSMPQQPVTVSARFVIGGFCGNPEVNNGQDVEWLLSDDRKTLTVSGIGEMAAGSWDAHVSNGLTVYLPATVTAIKAGAFAGIINKLQHVYSPVPAGQTLYANNQQVPDVDGLGDVKDFGVTQNQEVQLAWFTGYNVNIGAIAGVSCGLKVYADDGLTTEIPSGYKAICKNDETKVYVKALSGATSILFKNGLTVKAGSSTLTVTQESDDVFSFLMPKSAVTISAQFATGGYCGNANVNNGHNLIWTLEGNELAFQKNSFAQGEDLSMGDNAPWSTLGGHVKSVDLSGLKNIGSNAFTSCTNLVGLELPATPVVTVGDNAFASQMVLIIPAESWENYQTAGWAAYEDQTTKDKELLTLKDGQQWITYYCKVGRMLPEGIKAYAIADITENEAVTSEPLCYIPAHQAVLIENRQKAAGTIEATTSIQPNAQSDVPVCLLTTNETNLLQWLTEPMSVKVGQGYTLYKDEFVKVSSGTLPAGIAFLPAQGIAASRLAIFNVDGGNELTGVDVAKTNAGSGEWYTVNGKKLSGRPIRKGLYVKDGQKVVIR